MFRRFVHVLYIAWFVWAAGAVWAMSPEVRKGALRGPDGSIEYEIEATSIDAVKKIVAAKKAGGSGDAEFITGWLRDFRTKDFLTLTLPPLLVLLCFHYVVGFRRQRA